MIKHMLMFRFRADISEEKRTALLKEYRGFPKQFPWMKNFTLGRNISQRDPTYEYAFSIDFESQADLDRYLSSAEHEEHVVMRFRPAIEARAIVSYEFPGGGVTALPLD
jgi:hypothetical protein